ncbi:MAG: hypothetical protein GEU94_09375 [Micromonosporaceae bacterium]|nr:hypothetical protein [Micromonosporaceae bacterium]
MAHGSDTSGGGRRSDMTTRTLRLAGLIVAGLIVSNIAAALFFERDPALGMDEFLVFVSGVGLALLIEFGVFRRR